MTVYTGQYDNMVIFLYCVIIFVSSSVYKMKVPFASYMTGKDNIDPILVKKAFHLQSHTFKFLIVR